MNILKKNLITKLIIFLMACATFYTNDFSYAVNKEYKIIAEENFLSSYSASNLDGTYNAVIEIPSGSNEKWEVDKSGKYISLEFKNGQPRLINYLGYPTNFGFIPRTLLSKEILGNGDAIDVLVIGPKLKRGSVVKVKLLGMLLMKNNQQIDNKIIGVLKNSVFERSISSIKDFAFQAKIPLFHR